MSSTELAIHSAACAPSSSPWRPSRHCRARSPRGSKLKPFRALRQWRPRAETFPMNPYNLLQPVALPYPCSAKTLPITVASVNNNPNKTFRPRHAPQNHAPLESGLAIGNGRANTQGAPLLIRLGRASTPSVTQCNIRSAGRHSRRCHIRLSYYYIWRYVTSCSGLGRPGRVCTDVPEPIRPP